MKNPNSSRPTQCPFCKTSNYAVEYRGVKSKEERGIEQIEEQKVIEAKIRMRQQELQEEEERELGKEETSSSSRAQIQNPTCSTSGAIECEQVALSQDMSATQMLSQSQSTRQNRDGEFDLDLEDIMVMEAIWLSIQNERAGNSSSGNAMPEQFADEDHYMSRVGAPVAATSSSSSSPSGGLACAIAALAERQQLNGESPASNYSGHISPPNALPSSSRNSNRAKNIHRNPPEESFFSSSIIQRGGTSSKRAKNIQRKYFHEGASSNDIYDERMFPEDHWELDRGSMVAEAGTSYASSSDSDFGLEGSTPPPPPPLPPYEEAGPSGGCSDNGEDDGEYLALPPPPPPPPVFDTDGGFQSVVPGSIVPESFEEQMMLAMAVSLAEARARTTMQGVAWQ